MVTLSRKNLLLLARIELLKWESLLFTLSSLDLDLKTWTAARNMRPLTASFGLAQRPDFSLFELLPRRTEDLMSSCPDLINLYLPY